jgi:hypothetical protein
MSDGREMRDDGVMRGGAVDDAYQTSNIDELLTAFGLTFVPQAR